MVHTVLLAGLLTVISPFLASAAIIPAVIPAALPPTIGTISNCSSDQLPVPITYNPYFSSYGPQVPEGLGWEEWTFVLPDQLNQSMFHFRWTRGDPTSSSSLNTDATFSAYYAKTGFRAEVKGSFESVTVGDTLLTMSIGSNSMMFNGSVGMFGLWTVSVNIEGLQVITVVDPVTPDVPFEPTINGELGVLVSGYHVSHPVYRGHTNGVATLPTGESWVTQQVATIKHTYGYSSIQSMVSSYTRVSTFVGPNSLNWYTATAKSGDLTTAAQFVYGTLDLTSIVPKYQITNDPSILQITPSVSSTTHNYILTLAGCEATLNNPYYFNTTSGNYLGAVANSAGGNTEYWDLTTEVLFYIDGQPWTNDATIGSLGLLEVYTSA